MGTWCVLSQGAARYCASVTERAIDGATRAEAGQRAFLESAAFRSLYPHAYARWSEAETLLWVTESAQDFTTVGHKCREALQYFATAVVERHASTIVDGDPSRVNRRLGAVIAERRDVLGTSRAALLEALGNYSEATLKIVQRQTHGAQKDNDVLTWVDARRCVFHVAVVMFEFSTTLDEPTEPGPRAA